MKKLLLAVAVVLQGFSATAHEVGDKILFIINPYSRNAFGVEAQINAIHGEEAIITYSDSRGTQHRVRTKTAKLANLNGCTDGNVCVGQKATFPTFAGSIITDNNGITYDLRRPVEITGTVVGVYVNGTVVFSYYDKSGTLRMRPLPQSAFK